MVQRDYILRMIEMIGLMVQRIKEMITQGNLGAAEGQIEAAAARTGIELELAHNLDGESLLGLFMPSGANVDPTNALLLGEVMYLDGLRHQAGGDLERSHDCFAKALLLLQAASSHATSIGVTYPDTDSRVAELQDLLEREGGEI